MIYISLLIPFSNSYSRKLERKSSTFQRFSLFHGIRAVTFPPIFFPILDQVPFFLSPGIDQPVPVPTSSPSIVACLFFYLDGVYTHTAPRYPWRPREFMLWPPVRLPSFQPCFTYRPTPICSGDRGKPKGRLFLTDLAILFWRKRSNESGYIYIDISRKRREKSHFRLSQFRGSEPTVADTRRHLLSLSLSLRKKLLACFLE